MRGYIKEHTLCWRCRNAVPDRTNGCSWSRKFIPVEGWTAKETKLLMEIGDGAGGHQKRYETSYIVRSCPMFSPDDTNRKGERRKMEQGGRPKQKAVIPPEIRIMYLRQKERRERLKAQGRCVVCGKPNDTNGVKCSACRERQRMSREGR